MNLLSYVSSAAQAALAKGTGVPGLPAYSIGERDSEYEGQTIWSLHEGLKRDDATPVSIFVFSSSASSSNRQDRRALLPLARNALRKLRTLRHPDVLKFLDGTEADSSIYIITEKIEPLTRRVGKEGNIDTSKMGEWKVWGLKSVVTAVKFVNTSGHSVHGNLRPSSIMTTPSGEWRLGGFEVLSSPKDPQGAVIYSQGGLLPNAGQWASPETRRSGWEALRDCNVSALDAFQLHLLIHVLFNGPLPVNFHSDSNPILPPSRGNIPPAIHAAMRRLANPNPASRGSVETFCNIGMASDGPQGTGFFSSNRLVKLTEGLEGFALASEGDKAVLIKTIKETHAALPPEFLKYKVLPALVKAMEYGPGGPTLLPLVVSLGTSLPPKEYSVSILTPLVRLFGSPDRAMRMALLENLPQFADALDAKTVTDKVWPNLMTGFADLVPVIREATVKSVLLIAPKLSDRILNNDLLRHLAKAQQDPEPGIRTNTCILLGRLSKHLSLSTNRKVLIPAFARAVRDPFVHARIAGLMALMATVECFDRDDLAGRVIPAMSITLVDKEKLVRDQAFKAMDTFVKRAQSLAASMPDTAIVAEPGQQPTQAQKAAATSAPGMATSATGAANALAGWALTSLTAKFSATELATPIVMGTVPAAATNGHSGTVAAAAASNGAPLVPGAQQLSATASMSSSDATSDRGDWEEPGQAVDDEEPEEDDWGSFDPVPRAAAPRVSRSLSRPSPHSSPSKSGTLKLKGASLKSSSALAAALASETRAPQAASVRPISVASAEEEPDVADDFANDWSDPPAIVDDGATDAWATDPGIKTNNSFNLTPSLTSATDEWSNVTSPTRAPVPSVSSLKSVSLAPPSKPAPATSAKDERASKLAAMREERRARMAAKTVQPAGPTATAVPSPPPTSSRPPTTFTGYKY